MKIEYVKSKKGCSKLCKIPAGTVFSPINSMKIYIALDKDRMSDRIAVAHLNSGTLNFMHKDTRVNPLDCKLVVEE